MLRLKLTHVSKRGPWKWHEIPTSSANLNDISWSTNNIRTIVIIAIFEVKLTFEMLTVCGQQHSFSTHERVFWWKCQGRTFAVPCFEHWLWRYRYFLSKVNIWNVNCVRGQQHSFSTHVRVFLWKCQSFWDRKCIDLRGTRTPNLLIHAECSNLLSYQGQTFAVPCFEHWLWWYRYFWSKVNIWNVNCARVTAFSFDTRTGFLVKVSKFLRQKMSLSLLFMKSFVENTSI